MMTSKERIRFAAAELGIKLPAWRGHKPVLKDRSPEGECRFLEAIQRHYSINEYRHIVGGMIEAVGARTGELVGVDRGDQTFGDHQLENVLHAQPPVGRARMSMRAALPRCGRCGDRCVARVGCSHRATIP